MLLLQHSHPPRQGVTRPATAHVVRECNARKPSKSIIDFWAPELGCFRPEPYGRESKPSSAAGVGALCTHVADNLKNTAPLRLAGLETRIQPLQKLTWQQELDSKQQPFREWIEKRTTEIRAIENRVQEEEFSVFREESSVSEQSTVRHDTPEKLQPQPQEKSLQILAQESEAANMPDNAHGDSKVLKLSGSLSTTEGCGGIQKGDEVTTENEREETDKYARVMEEKQIVQELQLPEECIEDAKEEAECELSWEDLLKEALESKYNRKFGGGDRELKARKLEEEQVLEGEKEEGQDQAEEESNRAREVARGLEVKLEDSNQEEEEVEQEVKEVKEEADEEEEQEQVEEEVQEEGEAEGNGAQDDQGEGEIWSELDLLAEFDEDDQDKALESEVSSIFTPTSQLGDSSINSSATARGPPRMYTFSPPFSRTVAT